MCDKTFTKTPFHNFLVVSVLQMVGEL